MRIGLVDVDSHSDFPNLCLMKLSAYHKAKGDQVEFAIPLIQYDRIYMARVFDDTYTHDDLTAYQCADVRRGGTGYGLQSRLPDEVEHQFPDYSLYGITDTAYGFLTRGCPRHCPFCIVGDKEGLDARMLTEENIRLLKKIKSKRIHMAWDNPKDTTVPKKLEHFKELYNVSPERRNVSVYVLVNYWSTIEEDLMRIYWLRDMGYAPYVMVYNKPQAPKQIRRLQRWCNNRLIFYSTKRFEEYQGG